MALPVNWGFPACLFWIHSPPVTTTLGNRTVNKHFSPLRINSWPQRQSEAVVVNSRANTPFIPRRQPHGLSQSLKWLPLTMSEGTRILHLCCGYKRQKPRLACWIRNRDSEMILSNCTQTNRGPPSLLIAPETEQLGRVMQLLPSGQLQFQ